MLVQGSVVRMNNFVQRINPYPADKIGGFIILLGQQANLIHWIGIYPLDNVIRSSFNRELCARCIRYLKTCVVKGTTGKGEGGGEGACSFFACIGEQTGLRYLPKD